MSLEELIEVGGARVSVHAPFGARTTYRVGGTVRALVTLKSWDDLDELGPLMLRSGLEMYVLGNGSNLLVADGEHEVLGVHLGGEFEELRTREEGDVVVVDVTGQLLVFNHATGYPNIWWDLPDTDRDWGRILGSSFDRSSAVSVLDSVANGALSGGPLMIDPDGPGWLMAYSPDAGAPALTASFWASWRDSRLS